MNFLLSKLKQKHIWVRLFKERFTEPMHLNVIAFFVWIFGSYKQKIDFDLVLRPHHAYSLLNAANNAKEIGKLKVSLIEFGVATGTGLMNLVEISQEITKITGVSFDIYGFDTGKGMPKPESYKDHPEYYLEGDFKMNFPELAKKLPPNVKLIIGDVSETIPEFAKSLSSDAPIGFISFDLDYYSSTKSAFGVLQLDSSLYLPLTYTYFDDIILPNHNKGCGELLAIEEFNASEDNRRIEYHNFLMNDRYFTRAKWLKQIYFFHVLDHSLRNDLRSNTNKQSLENPYLNYVGNKDSLGGHYKK